MSDHFNVLTDQLNGHASTLDGVRNQLSVALDAARTVSMPNDAYGVICQFFPPMIDPIENAGVDAINEAVSAMGNTARAVRDTATAYSDADTTNAAAFDASLRE
jgi:Excreted virulence factor EspC, type VII ESX diderm